MTEAPAPILPGTSASGRGYRRKGLSAKEFVTGVWVVFAREFHAYFDTPIAYIFATVFLVLSCSIFMNDFFVKGIVDMSAYFEALPFLFILFIPAITMRVWAEEKSHRTFELLMTLPLHSIQIVAGKYAAALGFYMVVLSGSLPIVAMLVWLGSPDLGLIFANYAGALLLGGFFLAFGIFASGLTSDQISAFLVATMLGCLFVLSGHGKVVEILDGLAPAWQAGTWLYESVSVMPHYKSFGSGVLSLTGAFYFAAMSLFFLWMNELTLRQSRY